MLGTYLSGHPLAIALTGSGLLVMLWCSVMGIRNFRAWLRTPKKFLGEEEEAAVLSTWMAAMFFPMVLFTPVLNGSFDGLDSLRYNFAVFMLAPLVAGAALGKWSMKWNKWLVPLVIAIIGVPSGWVCVSAGTSGYQRLLTYKPQRVDALDRLADRFPMKNGVGNYWDAKRITMFSDKGLVVLPVEGDVVAYNHVNRLRMFQGRTFDLAVVHEGEPTRDLLVRVFRQDTGFHALDGVEVMLLPEWRFDPDTFRPQEQAH
ncbi:MAG: hypothetical protein QM724_03500 [Flavobacteriales bacterium]